MKRMRFFNQLLAIISVSVVSCVCAAGQSLISGPQDQTQGASATPAQDSSGTQAAPAAQPTPAPQPAQDSRPSPDSSNGQQQSLPNAPAAKTAQSENGSSKDEKELQKQEQSQRILGVAPLFGMTSRMDARPLTAGEKFHLFAKSSFDPFVWAAAGFQAGISQAEDEFPGYGQGAAGYGKRYGATLADEVDSNFQANFVYPVLLKEDPRYFRLGHGSISHRILYSLEQEFVCHTDKGGRSFNFSNVFGAFTSGAISNIYYPSTDRGLGLTLSRSTIALGYGSLGGLVDEFWPDIQRLLFHRHTGNSAH